MTDGPPKRLKPKPPTKLPPKLDELHPPPKQLKDKKISAGVQEFFRELINKEAYKRGMTQSGFILAAIDNYLNPKIISMKGASHSEFGIDRTPKGITATPKKRIYFGVCMTAFKQQCAKAKKEGKTIQKSLLIKKGELKIDHIKMEEVPDLFTLHANAENSKEV